VEAVRLLLRRKANPEARARGAAGGGKTALLAAAEEGHADVARFLLTGGASANARDPRGWTPLLWAVFARDGEKAPRYDETVATLLDSGADPNAIGMAGETALLLAVERGNRQAVARIVSRGGVKLNQRSAEGETALMVAAGAGEEEMVRALLAAGARVDLRNREGKTAWVRAAEKGSRPVMELLRDAGAREQFRRPPLR
jgi:ankyrin repeat protein